MPRNIIGLCAPLWTTTLLTICKQRNSRPHAARCQELLTSSDQLVATGAEPQVTWLIINRLPWSMLVNVSGTNMRVCERCEMECFASEIKIIWHEPTDELQWSLKDWNSENSATRACNAFSLVRTAAKINFTYKILVLVYYNSTYTHYKNYSFDLIFGILI
jgi:hypothetical protein